MANLRESCQLGFAAKVRIYDFLEYVRDNNFKLIRYLWHLKQYRQEHEISQHDHCPCFHASLDKCVKYFELDTPFQLIGGCTLHSRC